MARVSWSFSTLLLMGFTTLVVSAQRKNIEKVPILVPVDDEFGQVKGLYVKYNNNGELRFLANNANFQNALNNFINQQQDFLEQLRPTSNSGTGSNSNVPAISLNGNTITGLPGTTGTNGNGVMPIVVSLGGANGATANNQLTTNAVQALLPQIVSSIIQGQNTQGVANRRRPNANRRRRPNVVVLRPQG